MKIERSGAVYFAIQGMAVLLWWVVLVVFPETRLIFTLESGSRNSLMAFWLADLSLLGIGSLAAAWLTIRGHEYGRLAVWFVTGAISYAALYCLAFALITDLDWLGVTLMVPAMIWSGVFAVGLTVRGAMFRQSVAATARWILFKTFTQIVVVWSIILIVIPYFITIVEDKLSIERLQFTFQRPLSAILLVLISLIGITAAYTMSTIGQGTPLPLDHAKKLVVSGPYAYVRNPMAVSGIGQGLAVALFLGSPLVALYTLMGSLIWQLIFRPLEEDDMRDRFGEEYKEYCREVKCWMPRTTPYGPKGCTTSSE